MDKSEQTLHCSSCDRDFARRPHKRARWAVAGAGAIVGLVATDSIIGAAFLGGVAYGAAAIADSVVFSRRCPICGSRGERVESPRDVEDVTPEATTNGGGPYETAQPL